MKTRFLHCADIHLGYLQYGLKERFNDFAAAFNAVIDKAIGEYSPRRDGRRIPFDEDLQGPVDFVILAGDLFHKRSIDALTLNQAMRGLRRLRDKGIPCIAVEGNHERAYYDDVIGWMKFLALQDLIILLDAEVEPHGFILKPWDAKRRQGAYYEPKPGVRIYGMRYFGASTGAALKAYAEALAATPKEGVEYSIFVTHAGVEGQLDDKAGGVSFRQWSPLRPHIDYVALGHFHKPFQLEDWIYNPGSPEACSSAEAMWNPRGYWWVEVDTVRRNAGGPPHEVKLGNPPRRAFRRYSYKTDHARSPEDLMGQLEAFVERKALELTSELAEKRDEIGPPVIELYLTGVLPFDRRALDVTAIEALVRKAFRPLASQVKSLVQSAEQPLDAGQPLPRGELERQVLAGLFRRDVRYAANADRWAQAALALKQLSLSNASADAILEELSGLLRQLDGAEQEIT
ncbi:MAG: exonuclease SbcCD subunit D [Caldilinea sp.]|uniref:metallophosphoesterase family protein n=1 Tax=Caldilinea sp. TaxID=2293560 RepID=UPI0030B70ED5